MKSHKLAGLLSALCIASSGSANAQPATKAEQSIKCTSTPCGNTKTGEDPSDIADRNGEKLLNQMRETADDRQRWGITSLYSSGKKTNDLILDVIRAAGFRMSLQPQAGNLTFEKLGTVQTFHIAPASATPGDLCPRYGVTIVDASYNHAVIKKSCFQYEYKPKHFYSGVEYFFYDMPTASMRSIWTASTEDTSLAGPLVSPNPIFKMTKSGYTLDWSVVDITNSPEKRQIRLGFKREKKKNGKTMEMVCTDLNGQKGESIEQGACDGNRLEVISSSTGKTH